MHLAVQIRLKRETEVDGNKFVHHDNVMGVALNGVHPNLRRDGIPVVAEICSCPTGSISYRS